MSAGIVEYVESYLEEVTAIAHRLSRKQISQIVEGMLRLRSEGGGLFLLGVGGSAGHASHAVNDFRKIAGIESYTPTDNVSELTARINDDGWETVFSNWLKGSRLTRNDMVLVLAVCGGSVEHNLSPNIVCALEYARHQGATITGIVGRDG